MVVNQSHLNGVYSAGGADDPPPADFASALAAGESHRWVLGYEGLYFVTTAGRVYSIRMSRFMSPSESNALGHKRIRLTDIGGDRSYHYVHRLVLSAFDRPPGRGEQGRHLDGNPRNNHLSNLAWGSARDNARDRFHGPTNTAYALSDADVDAIRRRWDEGESARRIACDFGIGGSHVYRIVNRQTRTKPCISSRLRR